MGVLGPCRGAGEIAGVSSRRRPAAVSLLQKAVYRLELSFGAKDEAATDNITGGVFCL